MYQEVLIHISTFDHATQALREWAYVIEPQHLAMAREIEAEWCEGGTVSRNIEIDRPTFLFAFIAGSVKHEDAKRFASALATRMVDTALAEWHQGWDDVIAGSIRLQKNADGGMTFQVDVTRPDTGAAPLTH